MFEHIHGPVDVEIDGISPCRGIDLGKRTDRFGATGAVGAEMIRCLEERAFPVAKLTLLASARSAGKTLKFKGEDITIQELTPDSFAGIDIALFSAGGGISRGGGSAGFWLGSSGSTSSGSPIFGS